MHTAPPLAPRAEATPRARPPLAVPDWVALAVVAAATAGFGLSGVLRGVPGTGQYVGTIALLTAAVAGLRRRTLPGSLAGPAAVSVVLHLAGGLVQVGHGVLYNASPGTEVLRYDHLAHSVGIFVGTWLLWELLVGGARSAAGGGSLVVLASLGGLGLGAVNETVEFLATQLQGGGHVGGYTNTGWDLVVNALAGLAAGLVLHLRRRTRTS